MNFGRLWGHNLARIPLPPDPGSRLGSDLLPLDPANFRILIRGLAPGRRTVQHEIEHVLGVTILSPATARCAVHPVRGFAFAMEEEVMIGQLPA